jgi:SMC interacting uncharacterized protein involved in chromosome segregation
MNLVKSLVASVFVTLIMCGCATMNEQECLTADWESVGYADGRVAREPARLNKHRAACIEHGITADRDAYDRGYDKGIRTFCSEDMAFAFGTGGKPVPSLCPAELMPVLKIANEMGMKKYARKKTLDRNIQAINTEIVAIDQKIELINQEKNKKGFLKEYSKLAAASDEASKLDKLLYLGNAKLLKNEIKEQKKEIDTLEGEKAELAQKRLALQQEIDALGMPSLSTVSNLFRGR